MAWPVLVFDIESIPDIAGLRLLRDDPADWTDEQVYQAWLTERKEKGQSDFMPLHLQRVLVISVVFRNAEGLRVHSFVDRDGQSEGKVVQTFFHSIEKHQPQLVSWNGGGFDLPVIHYRAMLHKLTAARYWDMGGEDQSFKWNNYISRYHTRHTDLMDLLALYSGRANAPLDQLATLFGFPGKMGMDGSRVWEAYQEGRIADIRNYCETDVLNTWLVYLRFELMRGHIDPSRYDNECALVRRHLQQSGREHLLAFEQAWEPAA